MTADQEPQAVNGNGGRSGRVLLGRNTIVLGALGSAGFLAVLALLFVDFSTIGDVLRDVNYLYIAPALPLYFLAVYVRAARWRFLLRPLIGRPGRAIYPVVVVGYMANNLIPVRIGEVIRSYYLSLREPVSPAAAFGTVAVERASDVLVLLFFLAVVWVALPVSGVLDRIADEVPGGVPVLAVVTVLPFIMVGGVLALSAAAPKARGYALAERLVRPLPSPIRVPAAALLERLIEGLTVVRSARGLATLFMLSLPVWLLEAGMYYLISLGFDLRPVFGSQWELLAAILLFTAAANLAGIFPSSAGSWGPFDFFGAAALVALGVEGGLAAAYAVTVHVALWLPVTLLGTLLLVTDGTSLRQLIENARGTAQHSGRGAPRASPESER